MNNAKQYETRYSQFLCEKLEDTKYQSIKLSFPGKWDSVSEQNPLWLVINSYLAPEGRHKSPTVALYKVLDTK